MDLTVIVPVYNEEEGILNFAQELKKNLEQLNLRYEVLFINDGSTDKTQNLIESINWNELAIHEFQFNSGHMRALEAGFELAKGEMILTLDSDLQHPPHYIRDFIKIKKEQNVDVVYGVRDTRSEDKFIKRLSAKFYYFVMKKLSGINIRENAADFRLITKQVNEVLKKIPDENKIYRLLIPSLKFREAQLIYKAEKRELGKTKYSFKKMSLLALTSVLSFSTRPLRWAIWLGLISVIISLIWITYVIVAQISGWVVQGWTSLIAAVILFSGVQLFLLGIFGQYIGQIYISQQKHPKYLFKQK